MLTTSVLAGSRRELWTAGPKTAFPIAGSAARRTRIRDWLGGWHLGIQPSEQNIRIIRTALDGGLNFLDNAGDYNDGASEPAGQGVTRRPTARRPSS